MGVSGQVGRQVAYSSDLGRLLGLRGERPRDRTTKKRDELPPVAVGTPVASAPRTDPYVQLSRIRLLPRVCDGEALVGPGVKDTRSGEPLVNQPVHPFPVEIGPLAASGEYHCQRWRISSGMPRVPGSWSAPRGS